MRPYTVVRTFVIDGNRQPLCYCREEAAAQLIATALNALDVREPIDPPEPFVVHPVHLGPMDLEWLKRNEAGFRAYNERAEAWPFKPDLPLLPEDDHDMEHLRRLLTAGQDSPLDSEMDSLLAKIRRRLRAGNEAAGGSVDPHLQRDPDAP